MGLYKKKHAHRWISCSGYGKHTRTSLLGTTSYRKSFHTRKKHKNDHRIFFWKIVIFECEKYHWGKKYHCTHTCIRRTQKDERKREQRQIIFRKKGDKSKKDNLSGKLFLFHRTLLQTPNSAPIFGETLTKLRKCHQSENGKTLSSLPKMWSGKCRKKRMSLK